MTQVSRWKLRPEVWNQIFDILLEAIAKTGSKEKANTLIGFLLTPTEKIVLAKRIVAALLLEKGASYQDIFQVVNLSTATVSKIKNRLEENNQHKTLIRRLLSDRMLKKGFDSFLNGLVKVLASYGKGSRSWRQLTREIDKDLREQIL